MTEIRAPFNMKRAGPSPTPGGIGVAVAGGLLVGGQPQQQPGSIGEAIEACALELGRLETVLREFEQLLVPVLRNYGNYGDKAEEPARPEESADRHLPRLAGIVCRIRELTARVQFLSSNLEI
jgi:hypothetical protein